MRIVISDLVNVGIDAVLIKSAFKLVQLQFVHTASNGDLNWTGRPRLTQRFNKEM